MPMEDMEVESPPEHANNLEEINMVQQGSEDSDSERGSDISLDWVDEPEDPEAALARVLEMSDEMPQKPQLLNDIGNTFLALFGRSRAVNDIDNSILAYELAVQLLPVNDTRLAEFLEDHGISVLRRYDLTGTVNDINTAISSFGKAIHITPEGHEGLPALLNKLGFSLGTRFEHTGDLIDISEAISYQEKTVQLTPEGHAYLPAFLNNLGISLHGRFEHTGDVSDISEAISYQQKAIKLTPQGHADLPILLNNLGNWFQIRFKHTGDVADVSEAISYLQKAVQHTPEGHADLRMLLNNLGNLLSIRFEYTGDLTDISEAISYQKKAFQLTPENHSDLPALLNNLGISLQIIFERTGDLTYISEALSCQQKAVQITPEGHADLPARLNSLGNSLQRHFERTGDLAIISEAISYYRQAVQLSPVGHSNLPTWLNNLGTSLQRRFKRTGDLADISEAISYKQRAVQLTPEGHAYLPGRLNNLGISLQTHFERTGDLAIISEAVSYHQQAVKLTPESHAKLPDWLNNLGSSLQTRFERTGDLADISEATSYHKQAVQLTPDGHVALSGRLSNLGNSLRIRFERTQDSDDISAAISYHQQAVQLTPEGHADLPAWLNNLGISLQVHFEHTGDLAIISGAVSYYQQAVQLTPEGHADLPDRLNMLGNSLQTSFEHTHDEADIANIISHYRRSATCSSGHPLTRLQAAESWAHWAQRTDQSQLLEAYHTVIHLISQVAGLNQTIQKRYTNLIDISKLSAAAAAAALDSNRPDLALEWLEQGRCLVWSQLNDLRTPVDDLRIHDPALADEIVRVSSALQNAGSRQEPSTFIAETTMTMRMSIQEEAHTHIKLAQEWEQLLMKVRGTPRFSDFLRPASCATLLKNIPKPGLVVLINIQQDRSDALALQSGAEKPLHIALPDFSYDKANKLRLDLKSHLFKYGVRMRGSERDDSRGPYVKTDNRKEGMTSSTDGAVMKDILYQLWTFVVKPILDNLGHCTPASKIPRIWWCVTGPLAFLPIHAAGLYAPAESTPGIYTSLFDFAVSSYTPTVRSIIEKEQNSREVNLEKMGLLMISQPDTPNLRCIPGTTVEVEAIKGLLANHTFQHLCLESSDATVDRVKRDMNAYSCIHFACHAAQDTTEPLQSGFYLYDGRLELSAIIKEHLKGADLAFLSACQTSTGDEKLSEEAVHLAGGMLAAGYRGVVATMWSIQDSYGPKIAEEFYKNLVSHGADDENSSKTLSSDGAAYALHSATQQARKTLGDSESALRTWVPFVHFGL